VDAAPPQAARLSAIAPATNIERNRFILIPKSSSNALVLSLYRDKELNCASRIPHLARFCKGEGRFFAQCRNAFSFRCAFCANRANKKSLLLPEKALVMCFAALFGSHRVQRGLLEVGHRDGAQRHQVGVRAVCRDGGHLRTGLSFEVAAKALAVLVPLLI